MLGPVLNRVIIVVEEVMELKNKESKEKEEEEVEKEG